MSVVIELIDIYMFLAQIQKYETQVEGGCRELSAPEVAKFERNESEKVESLKDCTFVPSMYLCGQ